MTESIRVDLARETDYAELESFLVGCGFTTEQVPTDAGAALDVTGSQVASASLDNEVWDALTSWLAATARPLVPTVLAKGEYALTPPGE